MLPRLERSETQPSGGQGGSEKEREEFDELNRQMVDTLQGGGEGSGEEIDRSNDWTVKTMADGKKYLTTGLALYELLEEPEFAALCIVSPKDPSLLLYPYRDVATKNVIEPGKEYLGGAMPYVTEIMAKIAANRPWEKPKQSSTKTTREYQVVQRAQFDLKAGADEKAVMDRLNREIADIVREEKDTRGGGDDDEEEEGGVTWDELREQLDGKREEKKSSVDDEEDAEQSSGDEEERSVEEQSDEEEGQDFDAGDNVGRGGGGGGDSFDLAADRKRSRGIGGGGSKGRGIPKGRGFDAFDIPRGGGEEEDDEDYEDKGPYGGYSGAPALTNRAPTSFLPGYGQMRNAPLGIQNAPRGTPIFDIKNSVPTAPEPDEEDKKPEDKKVAQRRRITEQNYRKMLADAEALEKGVLIPGLDGDCSSSNCGGGGSGSCSAEKTADKNAGAESQQGEEKRYYDENAGYYDKEGNYWDADGGVWDVDGGYTDCNGQYFSPEELADEEENADPEEEADEESEVFNGKRLPVMQPCNVKLDEKGRVEKRLDDNLVGVTAIQAHNIQRERKLNPSASATAAKLPINKAIDQNLKREKELGAKVGLAELKGIPQELAEKIAEGGFFNSAGDAFPKDIDEIAHLTQKFTPSAASASSSSASTKKEGDKKGERDEEERERAVVTIPKMMYGVVEDVSDLLVAQLYANASQMRASADQAEILARLFSSASRSASASASSHSAYPPLSSPYSSFSTTTNRGGR